jgi:hypothetical protein
VTSSRLDENSGRIPPVKQFPTAWRHDSTGDKMAAAARASSKERSLLCLQASQGAGISRREFLSAASILGWLPFFRRRHIQLAGARFRIVRNGNRPWRYLLIHGNEETAREVLTRHMRAHEGTAFVIENHTREVAIEGGKLDPNRMFSRAGAETNLKRLNPDWSPERLESALALLDRGREKLVRALRPPRGGLLIALHNNSPNYSVADEKPISDATSIREPDNPHAFFLCTSPEDFRKLSTSPYNVVLQQKAPKEDDGSLSRLAALQGFRYINLEVALGKATRQKEMLDWLEWHL